MGSEYILGPNGELYHWGIKGMKWGVRRYQNKDGSLTPAGKARSKENDPYGLEKHDLRKEDRVRFIEEKISVAKKHVSDEWEKNPGELEKHKNWLTELNDAYEKYYFHKGSEEERVRVTNHYYELAENHPEAKKSVEYREKFIYDQASSRLQAVLDDAKAKNYNTSWAVYNRDVEREYEALFDAVDSAYNDFFFSDDVKHSELYHWGIKGMKWGVRRYQNKDGSLTPAGKKHYAAEEAKLKEREHTIKNRERTKAKFGKLAAKKAELDAREEALGGKKKANKNDKSEAAKPKSIKDMTDDELRAYTNRLQLEKQYYDAKKNLDAANPRQLSAGEKFTKSLMNDVIAPAAKNAGREWLEKTMKQKLGLNQEDAVTRLKKKYEKLDWEKKIEKLQKGESDEKLSWDDKKKQQEYEKNERNQVLEDIQREIAVIKAERTLREERKKRTEQGDD